MELGTFTAAADKLGISQASISELVVRLETEIAAQLFVRGGPRRLVPTAAASELLSHARKTLGAADDAASAMRSLNSLEGGVATFGVLRNAEYYGLSNLVHDFRQAHPGVRVRMVGLNSHAVAKAVSAGELEAGLVVLPVTDAGLDIEPLMVDNVLLATRGTPPPGGRASLQHLIERGTILYDATSGWDDPTRRQLMDRAHAAGLRVEPEIEVEHARAALSLVAAGAGATIVSASIVRSAAVPDGVDTYPFEEPFQETIALVTRRGAPVSRATQVIVGTVRRTIVQWTPSADT